ncbi:MAG TPA: hypothetical protein VKU85_03490, partial [bacterium]|nr:hypothetical protein [bacterium]
MHSRRRGSFVAAVLAVLFAADDAASFTEVAGQQALQFPLQYETVQPPVRMSPLAPREFGRSGLGTGWLAQRNVHSNRVRMAYGGQFRLTEGGVRDDEHAETLARSFLLANEPRLGTRPDNVELRNVNYHAGRYVAHYRQVVGGFPVWRADAFVLMGEDGRLTAFGSSFFPERDGPVAQLTLTAADAVGAAAAALGTTPRTDRP